MNIFYINIFPQECKEKAAAPTFQIKKSGGVVTGSLTTLVQVRALAGITGNYRL